LLIIGSIACSATCRFDQNLEYKCPTGAYHLCDFHKICRVSTRFRMC